MQFLPGVVYENWRKTSAILIRKPYSAGPASVSAVPWTRFWRSSAPTSSEVPRRRDPNTVIYGGRSTLRNPPAG